MNSYVVIPARFHSTRLPGKMLLRETGKSLIRHTFDAACEAQRPLGVGVATDHEEIAAEIRDFGGQVWMTDPDAASGIDRVAEVARRSDFADLDVIVNLQGDEPEVSGEAIDFVIGLLEGDSQAVMSTLATPIRSREKLRDPNCVKIVFDAAGRATYFSRAAIPHARDWDDALLTAEPAIFHQHIGLYAYRRDFLLRLADLPPCFAEQVEKLEQLRVINAGYSIQVGVIDEPTLGIDTADDYRAFVRRVSRIARLRRVDATSR
ncbi:MAG: 3-deoxy-manno-octulosonate cytidylyltransferase [Woeseiaceae bacterium]